MRVHSYTDHIVIGLIGLIILPFLPEAGSIGQETFIIITSQISSRARRYQFCLAVVAGESNEKFHFLYSSPDRTLARRVNCRDLTVQGPFCLFLERFSLAEQVLPLRQLPVVLALAGWNASVGN